VTSLVALPGPPESGTTPKADAATAIATSRRERPSPALRRAGLGESRRFEPSPSRMPDFARLRSLPFTDLVRLGPVSAGL
jgi:hypothetical protein